MSCVHNIGLNLLHAFLFHCTPLQPQLQPRPCISSNADGSCEAAASFRTTANAAWGPPILDLTTTITTPPIEFQVDTFYAVKGKCVVGGKLLTGHLHVGMQAIIAQG